MNAVLSDKQSYDAAFMSGLDFFLFRSSRLLNNSVSCQSILPSHGPCWHRNPSLVAWGGGGCRTCWRPLLFMRQCDPLCHPLSARGVCLHRCSLCSLYQPRVANEKHQVNTTTRTAMALNLLIHLDTTNWNPRELRVGTHPFSCRPQLKGKSSLMEIYRVMPGLTHLEPDLVLFLQALPARDNQ